MKRIVYFLVLVLVLVLSMSVAAVAEEVEPIAPPQTVMIDDVEFKYVEEWVPMALTSEGAVNAVRFTLKNGELHRPKVNGVTDLRGSKVGYTGIAWGQKATKHDLWNEKNTTKVLFKGYVRKDVNLVESMQATDEKVAKGAIQREFTINVIHVSTIQAYGTIDEHPVRVWQFKAADIVKGIPPVNGLELPGRETLISTVGRPVPTDGKPTTPSSTEEEEDEDQEETTDWTIGQPTDDQPDHEDESEQETEQEQEEPAQQDENEQEETTEETTDWSIGTSPSQDWGFGGQIGGGFGI